MEIQVPRVGESVTEVTIAKWHKKEGDMVKADELLCELESDKATFELNAEAEGVLHIAAKEGETIPVESVIGSIDTAASASQPIAAPEAPKREAAPSLAPAPTSAAAPGKVTEMKVPTVGESVTEVTVASWHKKEGDFVEAEEVLCELESDKATFELAAETSGILHIVAEQGVTLSIGAPLCTITATDQAPKAVEQQPVESSKAEKPSTPQASSGSYAEKHPSPAAAKILAEKDIEPSKVQGTGPSGRITKSDALEAQKTPTPASSEDKIIQKKNSNLTINERNERREKLSALRKTIARRLVSVKNETAMLTTFNEVDMKPIMDLRAKYKDIFKEKYEIGLGFMSFFAKAVCAALKDWPAVNASIEGEEIVYHDYCDISVAVSTPRGLVVPVVRNAERMSFEEIEKEIAALAKKARDNKLSIEEMTGGTFTITNGGVFGSMMSTPIINAPQSAILGMHNIVERPVAVNGEVVIRPVMYVALSYDHRIIDGRESVSFLVRVKQLLEDPARLLLGV